jgi:hypothetical protein
MSRPNVVFDIALLASLGPTEKSMHRQFIHCCLTPDEKQITSLTTVAATIQPHNKN